MTATVLAEYFVGRARAVVFVLRSDGAEPEAVELDVEPHEIESWVVSRLGPGAAGAAAGHLDASELDRIGAPLIAPVIDRSEAEDMLWFVPHRALHHVPLHAVNVAGQPLVERNPICYTPSAAVMRHCQNRRTGRRSGALVLGDSRDDLIHAREEAAMIAVMDEFYRRLLEGTVSKAESLRAAQRAVRTLTAGDLVAHCQARLQAVTADDPNRLVLLADRARARAAAGDIDAAVSGYRELETDAAAAPVNGGAELARSARNAIEMLSLRSELPWEADYSVCPFADPYHWAAVELVGDWR